MNELLKDQPTNVKYAMAQHWLMGIALEHLIRADKELKHLHDVQLINEDIADLGSDCLFNLSDDQSIGLFHVVSWNTGFDRDQLWKIIMEPDTL